MIIMKGMVIKLGVVVGVYLSVLLNVYYLLVKFYNC